MAADEDELFEALLAAKGSEFRALESLVDSDDDGLEALIDDDDDESLIALCDRSEEAISEGVGNNTSYDHSSVSETIIPGAVLTTTNSVDASNSTASSEGQSEKVTDVNDVIARAYESLTIQQLFPRRPVVKWRGRTDARFLVIVDAPSANDGKSEDGLIDSSGQIFNRIRNILHNFYREVLVSKTTRVPQHTDPWKWSLAMASFVVGWNGEEYRRDPNALELHASSGYIRELLKRMPKLELVITMSKFGAQFTRHNLNVLEFALHNSPNELSSNDQLAPTMKRFKDWGKWGRFHVDGVRAFRTLYMPHTANNNFRKFLESALFKMEDKKQPMRPLQIDARAYHVTQKPLEFTEAQAASLLTFDKFRQGLHRNLKDLYDKRHRLAPSQSKFAGASLADDDDTLLSPPHDVASLLINTSGGSGEHSLTNTYDHAVSVEDCRKTVAGGVLRDASLDRYARNFDHAISRFLCLTSVEYDSPNNLFHAYCSTPEGNPVKVALTGATFTFWFKAHPAYVPDHVYWKNDEMRLNQSHLADLDKLLNRNTYWVKKKYASVLFNKHTVDKKNIVSLSVDYDKRDKDDGYWHNRKFAFIRCEVRHYECIKTIVDTLKREVTKYSLKDLPEDEQKRRKARFNPYTHAKDGKFAIYQTFSPETMFIIKYRCYLSHWLQFHKMRMDPPRGIDPADKLFHCRQLTAVYCLEEPGHDIALLKPGDAVSLQYQDMTSSDMPVSVRMSYDIETLVRKGYDREYGHYIIAICAAVRVHDPKKTRFVSAKKEGKPPPDFTPEDGYVYYGFILGNVQKNRPDSELKGYEHVFEFADERDLLKAFFYFRRLLVPDYITGHNIRQFDEEMCINRARVLGVEYEPMGRRDDQCSRISSYQFQSKARGTQTITRTDGQEGISVIDTLETAFCTRKLSSYRLGAIAGKFVNMTKSDMPYSAIEGHWRESPESRRRLLDYCYRDAQLPDQIINCWQTTTNTCEVSRVVGTIPETSIFQKGMAEKVLGPYLQTNNNCGGHILVSTNKGFTASGENDMEGAMSRHFLKDNPITETTFSYTVASGEDDVGVMRANSSSSSAKRRHLPASSDQPLIKGFFGASEPPNLLPPENEPAICSSSLCDDPRAASSSGRATTSNWKKRLEPEAPVGQDARKLIEEELAKSRAAQNALKRKADYRGAIVMKVPLRWHYDLPVGCLDFAALYPSIIRWGNISSDAKVYEDEMELRGVTRDMLIEPSESLRVTNPRTGKLVRLFYTKKEIYTGLFVRMEDDLVAARNVAKSQIDKYKLDYVKNKETGQLMPNPNYNPNLADVMNQRSESLKLICNGAYGITGMDGGVLGDKDNAKAVTFKGQDSTKLVRQLTEARYGGVCVGGDTDSVFFKFPGIKCTDAEKEELRNRMEADCNKLAEDMQTQLLAELAKTAESMHDEMITKHDEAVGNMRKRKREELEVTLKYPGKRYRCETVEELELFALKIWRPDINSNFERPMQIDYEKAMLRFCPFALKRYAYYEKPVNKEPELKCKGLETVRRDSLPLTKETMNRAFEILLELPTRHLNPEENLAFVQERKQQAITLIREAATRLLTGQVSNGDFILSKGISREFYDNMDQEHLAVARKMAERGEDAPTFGDRVYYVYVMTPQIVDAKKGTRRDPKGFERAEDPEWAIEQNIPLDYMYYFEHKFRDPIARAMRFFLEDEIKPLVHSKKEWRDFFASKRGGKEWTKEEEKRYNSAMTDAASRYIFQNVDHKTLADQSERRVYQDLHGNEVSIQAAVPKAAVLTKNTQHAYRTLCGGKILQPKADRTKKSSIAFYADRSINSLEKAALATGTNDERYNRRHLLIEYDDDIVRTMEALAIHEKLAAECDQRCRRCLKITEQQTVACKAADCIKGYWPRITSRSAVNQDQARLAQLRAERQQLINEAATEMDIEDML